MNPAPAGIRETLAAQIDQTDKQVSGPYPFVRDAAELESHTGFTPQAHLESRKGKGVPKEDVVSY
jgi:hypothetical protein